MGNRDFFVFIAVSSIVLGLGLNLSGCRFLYEEKPTKDDLTSVPIDPKELSYSVINAKVLGPRCVSCHGNSGGVSLESLEDVRKHLPSVERAALIEKTMPKNKRLSRREADLLKAWIRAGAPEGPTPEPDPLKPTYTSIRSHVFEKRCLECHSEGGTAERVPLSSLKEILESPLEIVVPGNPQESGLVIAVERNDDKRMPPPKSGNRLSLDEIATIRKWIENGAPETE